MNKRILDPCCGTKAFWFDKENPDVEFCDIREIDHEELWKSKDGKAVRFISVRPNKICDVTDLPFDDNTFYHVVLDPPHLMHVGENAWLYKKYGKLPKEWKKFIHDAFCECLRVLKPNGTLIFKWSEVDVSIVEILRLIPINPLYGNRSGKNMGTHWLVFMKPSE